MTTSSTAITLVLLGLSFTVAADQKTDFQQAYQSYKQYMDVNDRQLALGAAADAYKLGPGFMRRTTSILRSSRLIMRRC